MGRKPGSATSSFHLLYKVEAGILTTMQITVGRLRQLFAEAIEEAKIGASPSYMQKEKIREALQAMIVEGIRSGDIKDQKGLDAFVATVTMASDALKMVPFDVYNRMAYDRH